MYKVLLPLLGHIIMGTGSNQVACPNARTSPHTAALSHSAATIAHIRAQGGYYSHIRTLSSVAINHTTYIFGFVVSYCAVTTYSL